MITAANCAVDIDDGWNGNSTVEAAVARLLVTNQLELRVLDANTVLIYPDTPAKQKEYQTLTVRSFYLANADGSGAEKITP